MRLLTSVFSLLAVAAVAIGAACGEYSECVPGASKACVCGARKGAALCSAQGAFGPCVCATPESTDLEGDSCEPFDRKDCACPDGGLGESECVSGRFGACVCDGRKFDAGAAPPPYGHGDVTVFLSSIDPSTATWLASAELYELPRPACEPLKKQGPCALFNCPPLALSPQTKSVTAGTITASAKAVAIDLVPNGTRYQFAQAVGPSAPPDTLISIVASGGVAPSFQDTVRYPSRLIVTAPSLPDASSELSLPRGGSVAVAWDALADATVTIRYELEATDPEAETYA